MAIVQKTDGAHQVFDRASLVGVANGCVYMRRSHQDVSRSQPDQENLQHLQRYSIAEKTLTDLPLRNLARFNKSSSNSAGTFVVSEDAIYFFHGCSGNAELLVKQDNISSIASSEKYVCYIVQLNWAKHLGKISCIELRNHTLRELGSAWSWTNRIDIDDESVFFRDSNQLVKYDFGSHQRTIFNDLENANFNQVQAVSDIGIFFNDGKTLLLIDKETQKTRWKKQFVGLPRGVAINNERLFASDDGNGALYVFARPLGQHQAQ